jgi:translation initiation factor IF-1
VSPSERNISTSSGPAWRSVTQSGRINYLGLPRQLGRATTLALVAGAPLIGTLATAEAQRGDWGYGREQERYQGGRIRQDISLSGVVTSDLPGDQFDFRADNGRTYRVVFPRRENEPRRISRGDRVSVEGNLDRDILVARDVRILDNRGDGGGRSGQYDRNFTTTGVVTSDLPGDQFDVRADNGRIYRVVFHRNESEPRRVSRGDRVSIEGHLDRDILIAHDVRILDNRGGGSWQDRRTLTGVVTRDFSGDNFEMRVDEISDRRILGNGRIVRVDARGDEPRRLSRGDRVTVYGRFSRNDRDRFSAETVRILDNRGGLGRRTFEGVVTRDLSGNEFTMRAENGRVFRVRARGDEPRRLSRGDRVTVYGRFSDTREDLFVAESVRITRNG